MNCRYKSKEWWVRNYALHLLCWFVGAVETSSCASAMSRSGILAHFALGPKSSAPSKNTGMRNWRV
jgi:hypothetical protein